MAAVAELRTGEYVVFEVALPGAGSAPAGVLLLDPSSDRLYSKFRRDWHAFVDEDDLTVHEGLADQLAIESREQGGSAVLARLEDTLSSGFRVSPRSEVTVADFERTLDRLYNRHISPTVLAFETHLPVYSLKAAAGKFGEHMGEHIDAPAENWFEVPEGLRLTADMFIAQVVGRSMEPRIPDGSFCVFRSRPQGSRQGKLLLVERFGEADFGARYTVKKYRSEKVTRGDEWQHKRIVLEPLNPEFEKWEVEDGSQCQVIAEFVCVLESGEAAPVG